MPMRYLVARLACAAFTIAAVVLWVLASEDMLFELVGSSRLMHGLYIGVGVGLVVSLLASIDWRTHPTAAAPAHERQYQPHHTVELVIVPEDDLLHLLAAHGPATLPTRREFLALDAGARIHLATAQQPHSQVPARVVAVGMDETTFVVEL